MTKAPKYVTGKKSLILVTVALDTRNMVYSQDSHFDKVLFQNKCVKPKLQIFLLGIYLGALVIFYDSLYRLEN